VNQEATQHARKPARSVPIGGNGISLGDNGFALEAFREIGPGRHYLGSAHTLANYQTAFYLRAVECRRGARPDARSMPDELG
jgi:trimethylamine:corrinoid methyltransferase-like protein